MRRTSIFTLVLALLLTATAAAVASPPLDAAQPFGAQGEELPALFYAERLVYGPALNLALELLTAFAKFQTAVSPLYGAEQLHKINDSLAELGLQTALAVSPQRRPTEKKK